MDDILEIITPSHHDQLFEGIGLLLDNTVGSDFEISCTNSTPIKAHFFVLQIFCHVLQNSSCRRIRFESSKIQRKDLLCLLEFIYRGKTQIQVDRLNVVKLVAVKLGLRTFLDLVEQIKIETVAEEEVKDGLLRKEKDECTSINTGVDEEFSEGLVEGEDLNNIEVMVTEENEQQLNFNANVNDIREDWMPVKCSQCSYQGRNLKAHLATKHQVDLIGKLLEKNVKCEDCEFTCVADFILKSHKRNVHGFTEHKCDECAYVCCNKGKLNRHKQLIHSNERSHMCETCGKCFKAADSLRNHKIMHSEKVDCEICGKKFSLVSIRRHRKLHEVEENITKYKCTRCFFRSRYRFNLKVHFKKIHEMSEEEIASVINSEDVLVSSEDSQLTEDSGKKRRSFKCRKKRVSRPIMKKAPKKRVCEICGVVLSCASVLFRHKRLHREGDSLRNRYKCSMCEFKTRERYNLKTHCTKKHRLSEGEFNVMYGIASIDLDSNVTVETEEEQQHSETYVMVDADIVNSILYI